jgi:hypothetical protein
MLPFIRSRVLAFFRQGNCWLLLPVSLGLVGCPAATPEPALTLPPVTTTGANTLGFRLDGRVWLTYGQSCLFGGKCYPNQLLASSSALPGGRRTLVLTTTLSTSHYQEDFTLRLDSVRGPGVYACTPLVNGGTSPAATGFSLQDNKVVDGAQRDYASTRQSANRITLTRVDTVQHIMSGTFEGQLINLGSPSTTRVVSQGRFDVTYQP